MSPGPYSGLTGPWPRDPTTGALMVSSTGGVTNSRGLRRWRQALADAFYAKAPVVCVGDSITYGQGADGVNGTGNNATDAVQGWPGQLRNLFSKVYGDPGEGFLFTNDSRAGSGTAVTAGNFLYAGPIRKAVRLLSGQALTTITVPAGVTVLSVVQANQSTDVTATYNKNAGGATNLTTLTGTGVSIVTDISVAPGDTVAIAGPATAQTYITGLMFRNTATTGVPVHRVGVQGYVSADALGGQTSGVMGLSGANQLTAIKKLYDWASGPGVLIVGFGVNDQMFQVSGGTAVQTGVTLANYTSNMQAIVTQAVADGWCVLLLGEPPNPSAVNIAGGQESDYHAALKSIALATDHCAFLDIADLWGTSALAQAAGQQFSASVHPTRKGYGDIARLVYSVLTQPYGETASTI